MADQLDQIKKQIDDLNKRIAALGGEFFKDVDKAILSFGGGVKGAEAALRALRKEMDELNTDVNYFYTSLKKVTAELKNQKNFNKDITNSYSKLSSIANQLKYDQNKISELSEKELETIKRKVNIERTELAEALRLNNSILAQSEIKQKNLTKEFEKLAELTYRKGYETQREKNRLAQISSELKKEENLTKNILQTNIEVEGLLEDQEFGLRKIEQIVENRLKIEKEIKSAIGLTGNALKALSKIPGIGGALDTEQALQDMKELARELKDKGENINSFSKKLMIAGKGLSTAFGGLKKSLTDPVAVLTFFTIKAFEANRQAVELGKSLGYGTDRADAFRESLVKIERNSKNINANTATLVEAFNQLTQATGFAYEFTVDQLETQIKLTKQVGLQAEEASQIQRLAVLNGKTSEQTYKSFVKGLNITTNQLKVGINFKATLAEAVKVSGQLAANLGYNPERIAKAIVTAKAFGMTLEQVARSGESLLNFESSIESELKAELLTGKQLNLERARAAALAGDQVTLTEELAKNVGTVADFTRMNVIQQKALAESVGMTADELAETLRRREEAIASGKSLTQITEEERLKALERQNIQDKFNAAILKLQSLIGNLVAGPLGSFIDLLSGALNIINEIGPALKAILYTFSAIRGTQLVINGLKKIALGYDTAMLAKNQIAANLGLATIGTNRVKLMLEKESLLTRIAGNIQLFRQLVAEQGIMNALKIQFGLQQANQTVKKESLLITMKDWLYEKGKAIWLNIQKAGTVALNAAKSVGATIAKRDAIFTIASAAMASLKAAISGIGSLLGPLAIPLGLAAAAGVAALGYNLLKGDDIMSEGGYGKRTLLAPEGAIKLNDKDTIIAGTNLGGGENISTSQIDLTPMVVAINEVRTAIDRLYNKNTSINMDSKKVGSTLVQNSYKLA
jgi:hypothetical protein